MRSVHPHDGRNAPWGPSCGYTLRMMSPTVGRVLLRRGGVAALRIFADAPHRHAKRA